MSVTCNSEKGFLEAQAREEHDTTQVGLNPDSHAFRLSDLELDIFSLSSFSAINGNNMGLPHRL